MVFCVLVVAVDFSSQFGFLFVLSCMPVYNGILCIQLDLRSVSGGRCAGSRSVVVRFSIRNKFRKPQGKPHTGHLLEIKFQISQVLFFHSRKANCENTHLHTKEIAVLFKNHAYFQSAEDVCFGQFQF